MEMSALILSLALAGAGFTIPEEDVEKHNLVFQRYWATDFVWKFDRLPTKGGVEDERIPYSGYIYPDTRGGTRRALYKYDDAFHGGRTRAASHEAWDTSAFQERSRGLLGLPGRLETPHWHGHCNGWAAAAIRHAEPQQSVRHNGVVFSVTDIKALLAEIYIYNDTVDLIEMDQVLNPGTFHAILANWLGRGSHPLGMEADPGEEKWNYPVYRFSSSCIRQSPRTVEVKTNLEYCKDSDEEYEESPRIKKTKYFHYTLDLNQRGEIVGGSLYRDSARIDMLWVPLRPKKSGREGNERGNPHVDVDKVLAIWRASVPVETRRKWLIVDPAEEDRVLDNACIERLFPVHDLAPRPPLHLILSRSNTTTTISSSR
jgi:hypothetical protein